MKKNMLILNGPNLNTLGQRELQIYGNDTLDDIKATMDQKAQQLSPHYQLTWFQTNAESEMINQVHLASSHNINFILINPSAFTHTSIALRDALLSTDIPFIELHISNIYNRETFRHHSYLSDIALGVITGFGSNSYTLALQAAHDYLEKQ